MQREPAVLQQQQVVEVDLGSDPCIILLSLTRTFESDILFRRANKVFKLNDRQFVALAQYVFVEWLFASSPQAVIAGRHMLNLRELQLYAHILFSCTIYSCMIDMRTFVFIV